jgi:hypothetical protein
VAGNFYATLAQVLPLLLLAFIWDSGFLVRLRRQRRLPRRVDSAGVWFWTKPRVRVYTLVVTGVVIISIAVTVLVLAGLIPDSSALRIALSAGLVLVLVTLLTRIAIDVIWATTVVPGSTASSEQSPGAAGIGSSHTADASIPSHSPAVDTGKAWVSAERSTDRADEQDDRLG